MLEIGRRALQHPESKPFVHDLLLSMALAEVREKRKRLEPYQVLPGTFVVLHFLIIGVFLEVCNCQSWI